MAGGICKAFEWQAALVDGASKIRVFFQLILPMAAAPVTTISPSSGRAVPPREEGG